MRLFCAAVLALVMASPLRAEPLMQPAELVGHAILPAPSFSAPPKDAPFDAFVTGKFLRADARVEVPLSVPGPLGMPTPFLGQPMQGLSGFAEQRHGDGSLYGVLDNGFGAKLNSPDILLSFVRLRPNFDTGSVEVVERVWLHDPDHLVPFRIAYEGTARRYLTGADFDPESLQVIGDEVWIGDEFGPYLISATLEGRITGVYPTTLDGEILRSPDHPALRVGVRPGEHWRVPRSGGFEGLLLQDGMLWAMLEKPILTLEGEEEGAFVRLLEFDPRQKGWTGRFKRFVPTEGAVAIGDINGAGLGRALVIERDHGQGDPALACEQGQTDGCFARPARVKRISLIDLNTEDPGGEVKILRQIDLMALRDPLGIAQTPAQNAGRFSFPFVTIESVVRDGPGHILVGNDNNLPFSAGRSLGAPDATEMIRLSVPELLAQED